MLKNNLKLALRVFKREKFFTAINIGGLAIGFATCILLLGYVYFEFSYENHIENVDQVYRVITKRSKNEKVIQEGTKGPDRLAQVVSDEVPFIDYATRAYFEPCLVISEYKKYADQKVYWVDKDFLKIFKGTLIAGDPETALDGALKMVITASKAYALFRNENPIGKIVKVNEGMPFEITGVVKDPPANTHFKYEYLTTLKTFVYYNWIPEKGNWNNNAYYNYIATNDTHSKKTIEQALNNLALSRVKPSDNDGEKLEFIVQPIKDIHLNSSYSDEIEVNGSLNQIYIIIGIGVAILLIVFINFINLSTTLSIRKAKDTGVRKTFGASTYQLKIQYFVEAFLLNISALLPAAILVFMSHSFIEETFNISLNFSMLLSPIFWLWAIVIFSICVFLVSFYPAFVLTSVNVTTAIKGKIIRGKSSNTYIKKGLLVGQFCASIFLTIGAYIVYQQVHFMENYDLGINNNQVLILQGPTTLNAAWDDYDKVNFKTQKYNLFKQELLKNPALKEVASCFNIPGQENRFRYNSVRLKEGEDIQSKIELRHVDEGFFPVYEAKILAGGNFEKDEKRQKNEIIINDKARKLLGFNTTKDAIGASIILGNGEWKIKGVTANFHMKSLSESILPTFFANRHPNEFGYYLVKLDPKNLSKQIAFIKSTWEEIYPEDPYLTHFSDTYFNQQYLKYKQFGAIFNALTILAILIANLGLVAMISLTTTEKLKEISVRRVLGANNKAVFVLMSKSFIKLIIIAGCIAAPIAWYFLKNWLNNFAYKIELHSTEFIIAVALILTIALCNILYFVIKVLKHNPATIIREE